MLKKLALLAALALPLSVSGAHAQMFDLDRPNSSQNYQRQRAAASVTLPTSPTFVNLAITGNLSASGIATFNGGIALPGVSGCLQMSGGVISGTGSSCGSGGGGGSPGGANQQIQFNNSGSFGGTPYATWNGVTLGVGSTTD